MKRPGTLRFSPVFFPSALRFLVGADAQLCPQTAADFTAVFLLLRRSHFIHHSHDAVSYTHLDVYKRQLFRPHRLQSESLLIKFQTLFQIQHVKIKMSKSDHLSYPSL